MEYSLKLPFSMLMTFSIFSFGGGKELIDLSYPYDDNTAFWPTGIPFKLTKQHTENNGEFWYAFNEFSTSEHCGTHLDSPYHFNKNGWKTADIPLNRLITTGVFVNASKETNGNCQYKLPWSKLIEWEDKHGKFPNNSVLIISFGWSSKYSNKTDYFGLSGDKLCFPGISKEASEWLTNNTKVVGVGVDSPSVDQGTNVDTHIELNSKNIYHLENVAITQPLPPIFKVIVLPMKIAKGTGAPCRVVAVV